MLPLRQRTVREVQPHAQWHTPRLRTVRAPLNAPMAASIVPGREVTCKDFAQPAWLAPDYGHGSLQRQASIHLAPPTRTSNPPWLYRSLQRNVAAAAVGGNYPDYGYGSPPPPPPRTLRSTGQHPEDDGSFKAGLKVHAAMVIAAVGSFLVCTTASVFSPEPVQIIKKPTKFWEYFILIILMPFIVILLPVLIIVALAEACIWAVTAPMWIPALASHWFFYWPYILYDITPAVPRILGAGLGFSVCACMESFDSTPVLIASLAGWWCGGLSAAMRYSCNGCSLKKRLKSAAITDLDGAFIKSAVSTAGPDSLVPPSSTCITLHNAPFPSATLEANPPTSSDTLPSKNPFSNPIFAVAMLCLMPWTIAFWPERADSNNTATATESRNVESKSKRKRKPITVREWLDRASWDISWYMSIASLGYYLGQLAIGDLDSSERAKPGKTIKSNVTLRNGAFRTEGLPYVISARVSRTSRVKQPEGKSWQVLRTAMGLAYPLRLLVWIASHDIKYSLATPARDNVE